MTLKEWRIKNNKTQREVADACKCLQVTISQIETNAQKASIEVALLIEQYTNGEVRAQDLLAHRIPPGITLHVESTETLKPEVEITHA